MAGRKSLLKATHNKPDRSVAVDGGDESKKKKAILDAVNSSSTSIKATLQELGLNQSTYYRWLKRYKAEGLVGLETGSPVSDELWQRLADFEEKRGKMLDEIKVSTGQARAIEGEQEKEEISKLLLKRFDVEPSKEPEKGSTPGTEPPPRAAEPKTMKEPPPPPPYTPPPQGPTDKSIKYAICAIGALACLIAILLMASLSNSNKFYFRQHDQMVDLWQGRFAPMGERLVASFSDPKIVEAIPEKVAHTKKQAFGILNDYFIKRSDEILNTGETPDLKTVKSYLTHASNYALSEVEQQDIRMRLDSIDLLGLLSKADLALSKGTLPDFEAASGYLAQAIHVASTDVQKDVLMKRLAAVGYALSNSKISKGERRLGDLYQEALSRHLQESKEYAPENTREIDKIKEWLDDFDKKHIDIAE